MKVFISPVSLISFCGFFVVVLIGSLIGTVLASGHQNKEHLERQASAVAEDPTTTVLVDVVKTIATELEKSLDPEELKAIKNDPNLKLIEGEQRQRAETDTEKSAVFLPFLPSKEHLRAMVAPVMGLIEGMPPEKAASFLQNIYDSVHGKMACRGANIRHWAGVVRHNWLVHFMGHRDHVQKPSIGVLRCESNKRIMKAFADRIREVQGDTESLYQFIEDAPYIYERWDRLKQLDRGNIFEDEKQKREQLERHEEVLEALIKRAGTPGHSLGSENEAEKEEEGWIVWFIKMLSEGNEKIIDDTFELSAEFAQEAAPGGVLEKAIQKALAKDEEEHLKASGNKNGLHQKMKTENAANNGEADEERRIETASAVAEKFILGDLERKCSCRCGSDPHCSLKKGQKGGGCDGVCTAFASEAQHGNGVSHTVVENPNKKHHSDVVPNNEENNAAKKVSRSKRALSNDELAANARKVGLQLKIMVIVGVKSVFDVLLTFVPPPLIYVSLILALGLAHIVFPLWFEVVLFILITLFWWTGLSMNYNILLRSPSAEA